MPSCLLEQIRCPLVRVARESQSYAHAFSGQCRRGMLVSNAAG